MTKKILSFVSPGRNKESMPRVSICIPTYKEIKNLQNNLNSILIQNYKDYEVIITDDTPDESVEKFIAPYIEKFEGKLKYYKNLKTLGSPENWNESIRKSSGDYIKILHHDDWFTKNYSLEKFVEKLACNPNLSIVASFSLAKKENGQSSIFRINQTDINKINNDPLCLFFGNIIGPPSSIIFIRDKSISFDTRLKWVVDIDYLISLMTAGHKIGIIEEDLITVSTEGEFKVTNDCVTDMDVILGEQIYLFNKIKNQISSGKLKYIQYIHKIMEQYNLESLRELAQSSYKGDSLNISIIEKLKFNFMKIANGNRVQHYIRNRIKGIIFRINKLLPEKSPVYTNISYSQCGEDLLISFVLMQLKIEKVSYVDIGAHHPKHINNTFLFYKDGAKGINIEPDPFLYNNFVKIRPKDINLNIGINDKESLSVETNDFFIMSQRSLNTFSAQEAKEIERTSNYKIENITKVETHDINSILDRYLNNNNSLDLLSIDTEGLDFQILKALNFEKFAPKILCVETLTFSASGEGEKRKDLIEFIISKGYFEYADTYINTIFVNRQSWSSR